MALCLSLWTSCCLIWCNIMCVHACVQICFYYLLDILAGVCVCVCVFVCVCLCKPLRLNSIPKISSEMPNSHLRKMCYIKTHIGMKYQLHSLPSKLMFCHCSVIYVKLLFYIFCYQYKLDHCYLLLIVLCIQESAILAQLCVIVS